MKFLIPLAVFICAVLATNEDDGRGQCTLDKFVVKAKKDAFFKGSPLGLKQQIGCIEYLTEMYKQDQFTTIDSKRTAYQLMDSTKKRRAPVRQPKIWSRDDVTTKIYKIQEQGQRGKPLVRRVRGGRWAPKPSPTEGPLANTKSRHLHLLSSS
jgi:hypothetical protein